MQLCSFKEPSHKLLDSLDLLSGLSSEELYNVMSHITKDGGGIYVWLWQVHMAMLVVCGCGGSSLQESLLKASIKF